MKTLILSLAASVALLAVPAWAADQKASDAASTKPMAEMTDAELHAHCKSVMGHKMDGTVMHDHASMKGTPGVVTKKPLSAAEMKAQHDNCTAVMAEASDNATKK